MTARDQYAQQVLVEVRRRCELFRVFDRSPGTALHAAICIYIDHCYDAQTPATEAASALAQSIWSLRASMVRTAPGVH